MKEGFRKIDNGLFEALMRGDFTGADYKVTLSVIHMTVGYQVASNEISLSKFVELTGLSKQGVIKTLARLQLKKVIRQVAVGSYHKDASVYTLNHFQDWTSEQRFTSAASDSTTNEDARKKLTSEPRKSLPVDEKRLLVTSQLATPAAMPIKEIKENYKENSIKENKSAPQTEKELASEGVSPPQTPTEYFSLNEENEGNGSNGDLDLGAMWQFILRELPKDIKKEDPIVAILRNAQLVGVTDHTLLIGLTTRFLKDQLEKPMNKASVRSLIQFATRSELDVEFTAPAPRQETGRVKGR